MGSNIIFDHAIGAFDLRSASVQAVVDYLARNVPNHPEFDPILRRARLYEATKDWRFDNLKLENLYVMRRLLAQMAAEAPAVVADWREESKPYFIEDLNALRSALTQRITRLEEAESGQGAESGQV